MVATGLDIPSSPENRLTDREKGPSIRPLKTTGGQVNQYESVDADSIRVGDHTERRLKSRHIQLIGIGGTIGTALFVSIGRGLMNGGPASLFIAFSIW